MTSILLATDATGSYFHWSQLILRGGAVLLLLAIFSVLVLAVCLERFRSIRLGGRRVELLSGLRPFIEYGDREKALLFVDRNSGPLGRTLRAGLLAWGEEREFVEEALWRQRQLEVLRWESRLSLLGTIGAVAPFVGLFGTVIGIIRAFQALAVNQSGGPGVVAGGIAEALITTAAGLFVAVPAVAAFNLFSRRIRVMRAELDAAGSETLGWLLRIPPRSAPR